MLAKSSKGQFQTKIKDHYLNAESSEKLMKINIIPDKISKV